jgi:hypothetical protein
MDDKLIVWTKEDQEYRSRRLASKVDVPVLRDLFPVQRDKIADAIIDTYLDAVRNNR